MNIVCLGAHKGRPYIIFDDNNAMNMVGKEGCLLGGDSSGVPSRPPLLSLQAISGQAE